MVLNAQIAPSPTLLAFCNRNSLTLATARSLAPSAASAVPGKYTVEVEGDFVIFIIGLYVHPKSWWLHLPHFFRTARAMSAMQRWVHCTLLEDHCA